MKFASGALAIVIGSAPIIQGFVAPSTNFNGVAVKHGRKAFGIRSTDSHGVDCRCPYCYHGTVCSCPSCANHNSHSGSCKCSSCNTKLSMSLSEAEGHRIGCSCTDYAMVHSQKCQCSTYMGSSHS